MSGIKTSRLQIMKFEMGQKKLLLLRRAVEKNEPTVAY